MDRHSLKRIFQGVILEQNWDRAQEYPVIHISFGAGLIENRSILDKSIHALIRENAKYYGVAITEKTLHFQFKELIQKLYTGLRNKTTKS
jgi:hypothetical protein